MSDQPPIVWTAQDVRDSYIAASFQQIARLQTHKRDIEQAADVYLRWAVERKLIERALHETPTDTVGGS